MHTKKWLFIAYGLLIVLVPLYIIFQSENILTDGHRHKIRLQGYDPNDPFRGKFLRLRFNNQIPAGEGLEMGSTGYVILEKDSLGFSYFASVQAQRPVHSDYIQAEIRMIYGGQAMIDLDNMSKYFINEDKASDAEEIIADYTSLAPDKIWLNIRVLDGETRIEDVMVKSQRLLDYIASGKHRNFRRDIERAYQQQQRLEQQRMERELRERIEALESGQEATIEFIPPEVD